MKKYTTKNIADKFEVSVRTTQRWTKRKDLSMFIVLEKGIYYFTEEALPMLKLYALKSYNNNKSKKKIEKVKQALVVVDFIVKHKTSLNKILDMDSKDVKANLPTIYIRYKNKEGDEVTNLYCDMDLEYPNGYNYVYLLEDEGYVGITNNLKKRIGDHRRASKKTKKIRILGVYKNRVKAHFVETLFHYKGYKGYSGN